MLKFPKEKVSGALFVGDEQEGPMRGRRTLFVVGKVAVSVIMAVLLDNLDVCHVYFGAGGRFDFDKDDVLVLAMSGSVRYITVESPVFDADFFKELKFRHTSVYWMYPISWQGKTLVHGVRKLDSVLSVAGNNLLLKLDKTDKITVLSIDGIFTNSTREGYDNDKVLYERNDA